MKRVITMAALVLFAMAGTAQAQDFIYGWSVSNSDTDPAQNTGAPVGGAPFNLYLWLDCSAVDGWSAVEMDLAPSGAYTLLGVTTLNGVLNAGSGTLLQLAVGGCPEAPFLAASISVFDAAGTGGAMCLIDSSGPDNWNVTVDCDPLNATTHVNSVVGYASVGDPCISETAPCLVQVEQDTWGGIKSLYR